MGSAWGVRCQARFQHLLKHPSEITHCFVKRASVLCRLERGSPPSHRHNNQKYTILPMSGQLSPVSIILLSWQRPSFPSTPRWLASQPPRDPAFRVCIDVGDSRNIIGTVKSRLHPHADLSWAGLGREAERALNQCC